MDKHIVIKKIPGKRYGFNYIVACRYCSTQYKIKGMHFNEGRRVYCSRSCVMKANPVKNWTSYKTGRFMKNGYVMLTLAPYTYMFEHRHVMEQYLGRKIKSEEVVHHIDHDRTNNDISNLQLTTKSYNSTEGIQFSGLQTKDPITGRFVKGKRVKP